jgi:hypothetical protein
MDFSRGLWTAPFPTQLAPTSSTWDKDPSPATLSPSGSVFYDSTEKSIDVSLSDSSKHGTTDDQEGLPNRAREVVVRSRIKPMPRKGHTKSRRGCYSCKRRKIKCNEIKPMCSNCIKAEISCEYPEVPQQHTYVSTPIPQPQSTPTVFSMTDLKLFHHFIVRGYPHLPVGADQTWTLDIPAYAHEVSIRSRHEH